MGHHVPPQLVRGVFYYLYLVRDILSRRIVAAEVHPEESADIAAGLARRVGLRARRGASRWARPARRLRLPAVKLRDSGSSWTRPASFELSSNADDRRARTRPIFRRRPHGRSLLESSLWTELWLAKRIATSRECCDSATNRILWRGSTQARCASPSAPIVRACPAIVRGCSRGAAIKSATAREPDKTGLACAIGRGGGS